MRATGIHFHSPGTEPMPVWQGLVLVCLACVVYAYGLGGQYVPTIGDEMVYAHIARMTAESGQWLPLASELPGTRNTKPPLLFWQAMVAGDWGRHWSLAALRWPGLLYTLLLSIAIGACTRRITKRWSDAMLAAALYLAFFSTFRFGRPYLTSAPESFWLSLPMLALLWQRLRDPTSSPGWLQHLLLGLALGLGLAYKSFALIAPAAAAWWLALIWSDSRLSWSTMLRHTLRVGTSAVLALGVFALWFALDPKPAEIWQEFIVAENAAKFSDARGYWEEALTLNGSSIWSQLLAYPVNAGFLFFAVLGLGWLGLRQLMRRPLKMSPHQAILLAWLLVWLLVFLLPSQRSARYVIPAMPGMAIMLALYWRDIPKPWFVPTLLLGFPALLMLARIAWVGHELSLFSTHDLVINLLLLFGSCCCVLFSLLRPSWIGRGALLSCLLIYASWGLTVAPMDGPIGQFGPLSQRLPSGSLAAPNNFNGQFERYRFLLPQVRTIVPYDVDARAAAPQGIPATPAQRLDQLLNQHAAVIWGQSKADEATPSCLPNCQVLAERWILRSRYLSGEITWANLWHPQEWLFRREWLLAPANPG